MCSVGLEAVVSSVCLMTEHHYEIANFPNNADHTKVKARKAYSGAVWL